MPFTEYAKGRMLNSVFTGRVFVSLHTGDPEGAARYEVSGGGYQRQRLPFGLSDNALLENTSGAMFEGMPVCTVTHVAIWDAESKCLGWGPLESPRVIANAGDTYSLQPHDISMGIREA